MGKTILLIHVINEMKLERDEIGFHFSGKLVVFMSEISKNEHLLSVCRLENPLNLIHVKDVSVGGYDPFACKDCASRRTIHRCAYSKEESG